MMSPRRTSRYGRKRRDAVPEGAYVSLSTSTWSPISNVPTMEALGITKACTRLVVAKSSRTMVTVHSPMNPRFTSREISL